MSVDPETKSSANPFTSGQAVVPSHQAGVDSTPSPSSFYPAHTGQAIAASSLATAPVDGVEESDYRSFHSPAIVSVILGVISIAALLAATTSVDATMLMCSIPLAGLFVGLRSWRAICRQPELWTGKRVAQAGAALSAFFLVTSPAYAMYVYATEVPPGYERLTFSDMKPDDREEAKRIMVPLDVVKLAGKRVFIKGYMRPSNQQLGLDSFLLVRDNNQCCFGDLAQVKYFDQMQVYLQGQKRAEYSGRIFRMGGILQVDPQGLIPGSGKPVFTLLADYFE